MTRATWDVLELGDVPPGAPVVLYDCPRCGYTAQLPVLGLAIAQIGGGGIVFDRGDHALPRRIRCRHCRRRFETD